MGPWALKRKKVPTAIDTALSTTSGDIKLSTMTPDSIVLHKIALFEGYDNIIGQELTVSPMEKGLPDLPPVNEDGGFVYQSPDQIGLRPSTPPTLEENAADQLFELPGSLLLPGQGFFSSPISASSDFSPKSDSESSVVLRRKSAPSLCTSSTDNEHDHIKNWTARHRTSRANTSPTAMKSGMTD